MSWKPAALAAAAAVAAVALATWSTRNDPPVAGSPSRSTAADARPGGPPAAPPVASAPSASDGPVSPDHPMIKNYASYMQFQQRTRAYFDEAGGRSLEERRRGAAEISREIAAQEADGKLLPVEALFLNIAILKHTSASEEEFKAAAERITAEFRAQAERLEAERIAQANADPRFVSYKAREAAIVQEAMAMPEGPARDEYLRRRLEDARIEAYRAAR